jgi:hypothetical protein
MAGGGDDTLEYTGGLSIFNKYFNPVRILAQAAIDVVSGAVVRYAAAVEPAFSNMKTVISGSLEGLTKLPGPVPFSKAKQVIGDLMGKVRAYAKNMNFSEDQKAILIEFKEALEKFYNGLKNTQDVSEAEIVALIRSAHEMIIKVAFCPVKNHTRVYKFLEKVFMYSVGCLLDLLVLVRTGSKGILILLVIGLLASCYIALRLGLAFIRVALFVFFLPFRIVAWFFRFLYNLMFGKKIEFLYADVEAVGKDMRKKCQSGRATTRASPTRARNSVRRLQSQVASDGDDESLLVEDNEAKETADVKAAESSAVVSTSVAALVAVLALVL